MKKSPSASQKPAEVAVRLDVWLWSARFFKTRALAKHAVNAGKVSVNEIAGKASRLVRVGDRLEVLRGEERLIVVIAAVATQRGPAASAQQLYRETGESRAARTAAAEQRRLQRQGYARPPTKPDKRARRLIIALGDIDAL